MTPPQRQRIDDYVRSSRREWLIKLLIPIISIATLFIIGLVSDNAETRAANRAQAAANRGKDAALDSVNQLLSINSNQRDSLRKVVDSLTSVREEYIYQRAWGLDSSSSRQTVTQSIRANQALQSLIVGTTPDDRGNVVVRYHEKRRDKQRIEFALRELGYEVDVRAALTKADEPTNSIAYGPSVPFRDLKLIALTLVRGGTQLRSICPMRAVGERGAIVEVNYSPRATLFPPIELSEINALANRNPQVNCGAV